MEIITKISRKGQVTIPKKIRDLLNSNNEVTIEPVKDVGGSLAKFANKKFDYNKERDIAWGNVVKK